MRSFIEPYAEDRKEINQSILPIKELIHNKHVVIVDDSIVRGTSSESIIKSIKNAGARKITMVITFPPIRYPCYAGIDFPSQEELLAFQHAKNENSSEKIGNNIAKKIGADKVIYNDNENLALGIGLKKDELCFSCSTGNYSSLGIKPNFKTKYQIKDQLLRN
jgi:amidophosphoribosyltransferase